VEESGDADSDRADETCSGSKQQSYGHGVADDNPRRPSLQIPCIGLQKPAD
jgi:hypothetical protein